MLRIIKILFIILIGSLSTICYSQQWTSGYQGHSFGDNLGTDNKAYTIAAGDDGGVYVAGYSGSFMGSDLCAIKYNGNGDTLWTRFYHGLDTGENKAYAVIVDKLRNILVTGYITTSTGTDIITLKYDPDGNLLWHQIYNGTGNGDDKAYAITLDSYNNIYITGYATDSINEIGYITIRYDTNGFQRWAKFYTDAGHSAATSITMVRDQYVAVTGSSVNISSNGDIVTILYDAFTGDQLWAKALNKTDNIEAKGNAITSDNDGNVYVTGYTTTALTGKDISIIKYDNSGNITWDKEIDNLNFDDVGNSIGLSANNDILVTGTTATGMTAASDNYITLSYSTNGDLEWSKNYNGPGGNKDVSNKMAVSTTENAIYVTGSSMSDSYTGSTDMFTVKYDISTGDVIDSSRISTSSANEDVGYDIVVDAQQNVFVTGFTIFGGNRLNAAGSFLTTKFGKGKLSNKNTTRSIPKNFKLYQNYPNPFNPGTTIKFELAKQVQVRLVVYDVIGREVQTLIDNNLNAGIHTVNFNKPGLSSGIYFYELIAGDFRDIKKMVILK